MWVCAASRELKLKLQAGAKPALGASARMRAGGRTRERGGAGRALVGVRQQAAPVRCVR